MFYYININTSVMDFGEILSAAQKNENNKQPAACYRTKYTPPKKESKHSKLLSENIKKFLAKKEEEDRRKATEEKKKKQNLLALRDHKTQSRINKHLKVCKAANKSVLADAVDTENTAVTMAGPSQPDEDDYGYVSQEASAFHNKFMNKYNNMSTDKPLFSCSGKKSVKDIASTKDRVKKALKQQQIEESQGHRRKRKSSGIEKEHEFIPELDIGVKRKGENENQIEKSKYKKKSVPPPIDFVQLLKLAEKKQHEPVVIEVKPKNEEPERLLTRRQIKEFSKEKQWRNKKEDRLRNFGNAYSNSPIAVNDNKYNKQINYKTQVINYPKNLITEKELQSKLTNAVVNKKNIVRSSEKTILAPEGIDQNTLNKEALSEERRKLHIERKKLEEMRRSIKEEKRKLTEIRGEQKLEQKFPNMSNKISNKSVNGNTEASLKGTSMKCAALSTLSHRRSRLFSDEDLKSSKDKRKLPKNKKQLCINSRRPAVFADDEDEYDSELNDFIDDGHEEGSEDYSKYISEIFGYDKSKYKNIDEDDAAMESNFAQQLKEEYVSTKIGIMEDLEDIRMEAMEKKRKAFLRKKQKI